MKKLVILLFAILSFAFSGIAQFEMENFELLDNWDNDGLPEHVFGTFNDVWGYTTEGKEYAIMGSASYIHFFDVTDPKNIELVAQVEPGASITWRDFKVFRNYLYAVSDASGEGMLVIDMTGLPESVEVVKILQDEFTSAHNVYLEEETGRVYVVGASPSGTYVYDVCDDPANPAFLGHANMNGNYVHDIYVKDNIAYASSGNAGFYIWDLTDPNSQNLLAFTETNGYNHSSWIIEEGKYVIFAEEVPTGLPMGIMDIQGMMAGDIQVDNYFKFPLLAPIEEGATPHNPYVIGNYAYTSYYQDGLVVFDVSDPTSPTRAGYIDTYPGNTDYPGYQGAWGCYPFLPSGNILVSDMDNGLFVVDFDLDEDNYTAGPTCGVVSSAEDIQRAKIPLLVYPNPTEGLFSVAADLEDSGVINVYSATGVLLRRIEVTEGFQQVEVDLEHYATGVYFVELETGDELRVERVLVR